MDVFTASKYDEYDTLDEYSEYKEDENILCFNATVDEKGRILVPSSIRRMLGISKNKCVSVALEPISAVKRFKAESRADVSRIIESVDDVVNYRQEGGFLEVMVGGGRSL